MTLKKIMGSENKAGRREEWRNNIACSFSGPAIAIFGCFMLNWVWIALALFSIFSLHLLTSGVRQVFHLLPALTRYLILTAPVVFVLGWILSIADAGQATKSILAIIYVGLQVISNSSIPLHLESCRRPDS